MRSLLFAMLIAVGAVAAPVAKADVQTGKIVIVMENKLTVMDDDRVHHFDIGDAAIYRNGLPVPPAGLASGDWVTVTTELQEGRLVASLVEAGGDHRPANQ